MDKPNPNQQIVTIAEEVIAGKIGIIVGSRELVREAAAIDSEIYKAEFFRIIRGIDSESDTLPVGPESQYWNKDVLKIKDQRIADYESRVREVAFEACQTLVATYKSPTSD